MFPKPSKKSKERSFWKATGSDSRQALNAIYSRFVRPAFLAGLARGQGKQPGEQVCERCGLKVAQEVHHLAGRDGEKLNDWSKLRGLCNACHDEVHAHPEQAYQDGWLERRNAG